jgi:hypothetical protein
MNVDHTIKDGCWFGHQSVYRGEQQMAAVHRSDRNQVSFLFLRKFKITKPFGARIFSHILAHLYLTLLCSHEKSYANSTMG